MAPKYKISYFDIKALAEPIRLLMSYVGIDFEDNRVSSEDWPKFKASTPNGQMPVLEVDGEQVTQSNAIARYFAKMAKLAGNNDWEAMKIDEAVDTIHDLRTKVATAFYEPDESIKEEKYKLMNKDFIPSSLKRLESMAAENKGHMALGRLTWADFVLAGLADYLKTICRQDIFADNPNLKATVATVNALPAIKAWYAKSPKRDF